MMLSQMVKECAIHGSEQIPVATPSRALAEFWGRYRKLKPHVNPMMPLGSTSEEPSASTNLVTESSAVPPTDPVTPAGTEATVHSTAVGAVSGGADASTGVPVGLDKRGSSSSFASEEIESGWRYDEKCKKNEAKLAQAVPGDATPCDGPTIPTMDTTTVSKEPSTSEVVAMDVGTTPVPADASTGPAPTDPVIAEYQKLATDQALDANAERLKKWMIEKSRPRFLSCKSTQVARPFQPMSRLWVKQIMSLGIWIPSKRLLLLRYGNKLKGIAVPQCQNRKLPGCLPCGQF